MGPTMVPDTDVAVMAVVCTDTARGPLMPMLTMAMVAMEVMEAWRIRIRQEVLFRRRLLRIWRLWRLWPWLRIRLWQVIPFKVCNNILKPNCHPNHISEKIHLISAARKMMAVCLSNK